MEVYLAREAEVHTLQKWWGMEPRDDSHLTKRYASGELGPSWTSGAVAHELVCVNHIFWNTSYSLVIEQTMRDFATYLRDKHCLHWGDTWEIVRKYAPSIIKLFCVHTSKCRMPAPPPGDPYGPQSGYFLEKQLEAAISETCS